MYEWQEGMGEISGFGADSSYEAGCRLMVKAGLEWWDQNPAADPQFQGFRGVFGLITETNKDAEALTQAMMAAPYTDPESGEATTVGKYGATGAMHQACVGHIFAVRRMGWDAYVAKMSEPEESPTTEEAAE